mgnify:CR=1 FL=1
MIFDGFVPAEGSPLYRQIIRHIQRGLVAGTIRFGDELPSRRTLSALLGVNPNTVQKAYRILEEEGIITSHTGAKSLVAADEETVERVRRALLAEEAGGLVRAMRQMGVSQEEALAEIRRLWDGPLETEGEEKP